VAAYFGRLFLLFKSVGRIARRVFHIPGNVVRSAFGLVELAICFQSLSPVSLPAPSSMVPLAFSAKP
jgi:hypothetical protein